jgi:hypothetical protein
MFNVIYCLYCSRCIPLLFQGPATLFLLGYDASRCARTATLAALFVVSLPTPQATASSADIIPTPHFLTTIFETDQFTGMSSECIGGIMGALCGVGVIWTVVAIVVRSKDSITRQVNPLTSYSATAVGLSRNNACPHMENVASMGWPAHRDYPICLGLSLAFTLSALFSGWERE